MDNAIKIFNWIPNNDKIKGNDIMLKQTKHLFKLNRQVSVVLHV